VFLYISKKLGMSGSVDVERHRADAAANSEVGVSFGGLLCGFLGLGPFFASMGVEKLGPGCHFEGVGRCFYTSEKKLGMSGSVDVERHRADAAANSEVGVSFGGFLCGFLDSGSFFASMGVEKSRSGCHFEGVGRCFLESKKKIGDVGICGH
jgi:hypothetical protein